MPEASAPVHMHVNIQWTTAKPIDKLAGDKLKFGNIPEKPGVYRIRCEMPGRPLRVYVGEAENLKNRIDNYGRPYKTAGGRVSPNRGINRRLVNVLRRKGAVARIQVATQATVNVGAGRTRRLKMTKEFHRLLVEAAAIVYEQMYTDAIVINAARPDVVLR